MAVVQPPKFYLYPRHSEDHEKCDTMIAHNLQYPRIQNDAIVVIPSAPRYADQMIELMCAAYGCSPDETFSAGQFRSHMQVFPEGQFIALDVKADRVVGLTASMRLDFDPRSPLTASWVETTAYG